MKHCSTIFFATMFAAVLLACGCSPKGNAEASFWVRGNCDMCKERIESTLGSTKGVVSASYDVDAQTVTVGYDSTAVKVPDLHRACANAGHETKLSPAPAEAEAALPKCCQKGHSM